MSLGFDFEFDCLMLVFVFVPCCLHCLLLEGVVIKLNCCCSSIVTVV
ncbi:hypothetical protein [Blochmannia endosymbiont of Camponotus sp.]|nr:hypothetical protein [Blochmannia endosymbiont of Camponotus sp.]URJ23843.1 hypothetical protein M9403_02935 [Blochmannia endosymbiont of Camponotus sp.]